MPVLIFYAKNPETVNQTMVWVVYDSIRLDYQFYFLPFNGIFLFGKGKTSHTINENKTFRYPDKLFRYLFPIKTKYYENQGHRTHDIDTGCSRSGDKSIYFCFIYEC